MAFSEALPHSSYCLAVILHGKDLYSTKPTIINVTCSHIAIQDSQSNFTLPIKNNLYVTCSQNLLSYFIYPTNECYLQPY